MLEGYINKDDKFDSITLNYRGEGLFTFKTKFEEGDMNQPTSVGNAGV